MTARTHDLAAFTGLTFAFVALPTITMNLGTLFVAFLANMLGGLIPDLDNHSAEIWDNVRGGSIVSFVVSPLLGGHRMISHSIVGLTIFGFLVDKILMLSQSFLIVNHNIVWWAFMIGYLSHLLMDMITKEGVPLFFPLPFKIGLPPFRFMRFTTGKIGEKALVFPSLMIVNAYLVYENYSKILEFLQHSLK